MLLPPTRPTSQATPLNDALEEWIDVLEGPAPRLPDRRPGRPRQPIGKILRRLVYERDGWSCRLCGIRPPVGGLNLDHICPHGRGGSNRSWNLRALCRSCNTIRSDSPDRFDEVRPAIPVTQACDSCSRPDLVDPDARTMPAYCGSCGVTSPTDVAYVL